MKETLASVGEFGLIHRIRKLIEEEGIKTPGIELGIGDDSASLRPRAGYDLLVTCDCFVEGRHFLRDHIPPFHLGRRAMVANISDIGAMGGHPLYALISLGLKKETSVADVEAMYRGFLTELAPFEASVIGGNITGTEDAMFIDITLLGDVKRGQVVLRSTAQEGDAVLVTGYPGQAAAGLKLLLSSPAEKNLKDHPLVRSYTIPSHRAWEGQAVARSGLATAMIDTSDGLLGDLGHICEESGVGVVIFQEKLPVSQDLKSGALRLGWDPFELVLHESDDYELIITCSSENVASLRSLIVDVSNVPVSEIGRITDKAGELRLILTNGTERPVSPEGWDHFSR